MKASLTTKSELKPVRDFYYYQSFVELEADWTSSEAHFIQIREDDDTLTAEFPVLVTNNGSSKAVTSPYGYGGPQTSFFRIEAAKTLHELACEQGWSTIFLRCHPVYGRAPADFASPYAAVVESGKLAVRDLSCADDEQLLASYSKGLRRDIRRARRESIEVTIETLEANIDEFSAMYHRAMHRLDARPALKFSASYMRRFATIMGSQAFLVRCVVDGRVAAAGCFVATAPIAQYHLSAADYDVPLAGYAMKLVIHEGLLACQARGIELVNLGGGLGGEEDGLFDFKRRFSSELVPYQTFRMVGDPDVFQQMHGTTSAAALRLPRFPPEVASG